MAKWHLWVVLLGLAGLFACTGRTVNGEHFPPMPVDIFNGERHGLGGVVSYDVYSDGEKLHAVFAAATKQSKQLYIAYLRSDGGGLNWSAPVEISQAQSISSEVVAGNDVQIAAHGDSLLAVWQITGEIPGMGPLASFRSLDGGRTWEQGANPTASDVDQSHPDLIADKAGRFHLVWLDDRDENGYQGVRYAQTGDIGRHWELAQTIDESSCSCCWNRLLQDHAEGINVLYRDMEPRDMAMAQSGDNGRHWQRLSTVGEFNWKFDGCPHNGGAIAETMGVLHALVWTGAEGKAGLYYLHSLDDGHSWSLPRPMGVAGGLAFHSDIAAMPDGRLLAIWDARGADGAVVMISESLDNGKTWSAERRLSTIGGSANFPRVVATANGFRAMWLEQRPGANRQWFSAIIP